MISNGSQPQLLPTVFWCSVVSLSLFGVFLVTIFSVSLPFNVPGHLEVAPALMILGAQHRDLAPRPKAEHLGELSVFSVLSCSSTPRMSARQGFSGWVARAMQVFLVQRASERSKRAEVNSLKPRDDSEMVLLGLWVLDLE